MVILKHLLECFACQYVLFFILLKWLDYARLLITWLNLDYREIYICPELQVKLTCIEWGVILMADLEREWDVMKKEDSGSRLGGSYVLGRSQNGSPNPILRDVNTVEDN